jgi:hypothetical protein
MEQKDIFFIIGIISSLIISSLTLLISIKNRRNALREHLYKEQMMFFSKFMSSVNKLNIEVQSLMNDPEKRKNNDFEKLLEAVSYEYYNCQFLIPNEISGLMHDLIFKAERFYSVFLRTDQNTALHYSIYFDSYSKVLDNIKTLIGTNALSKENKSLHSQNKHQLPTLLNLITSIRQKVK